MVRSRHLSCGVVLISILLVLALLAAVAYRLMGNHSLLIAQSRLTFGSDAALSYAMGAEQMARQVLYQEWQANGPDVDNLTEIWAQPLAPFALPEYQNSFLEIQIRDMNGCFNLNALAGAAAPENLLRLKTLLRSQGIPDQLADAWRDWVDADDQVSGFGAEDTAYLVAEIPYRTPNSRAGHWSEFNLLPDIELEQLELMAPLLCTLPSDELRVNLNTASTAVLESLVPGLPPGSLENLAGSVPEFRTVSEFTAEYPDLMPATDVLAVRSEYFEVHVRALIDGYSVELASVLHRDPDTGRIKLLARNLGKQFKSLLSDENN